MDKIKQLLERGVEEVIKKEHLEKALKAKKKLRVKFGIDPTAKDLHLGHTVPLRKLKQFQDLGHTVIFLIGDFTATIGDPSGRTTLRKELTAEDVKSNMASYTEQAAKVLNMKKVETRYNSEWYKDKKTDFLMQLSSRFTYARLIERDEFQKRIKKDIDISMLELIYPLLQGYDSVALKSDVEIGGADQKFNLLMGRKVQKRYEQPKQDVITVPLLEGLDGVHKMSKSYNNYIGLMEDASAMYGKIMSIPDTIIWRYLNLLTDIPTDKIEEMKKEVHKTTTGERDVKALLAREIVKQYHSEEDAKKAEKEFTKIFTQKEKPSDIKSFKLPAKSYKLVDLLPELELVDSKGEGRRLIEQGAVRIDDEVVKEWDKEVAVKSGMVVQVGKRKFAQIK